MFALRIGSTIMSKHAGLNGTDIALAAAAAKITVLKWQLTGCLVH
jgi:hypothetical protein